MKLIFINLNIANVISIYDQYKIVDYFIYFILNTQNHMWFYADKLCFKCSIATHGYCLLMWEEER